MTRKSGKRSPGSMAKKTSAPQGSPKNLKILVVGVEESERDSIVDMVIRGNRRLLPKLVVAKLPDFSGLGSSELREKRPAFYERLSQISQREGVFVISGSLAFRSRNGIAPLFTGELLGKFVPDMTILLEVDVRDSFVVPGYGIAVRKNSAGDLKLLQEMNRHFASLLGGPVTVLNVNRSDMKKALRTFRELLMSALEE